jgi:hypothetical protein
VFKQSAVVDVGFVRLRGATAWWLWGIVHVLFLSDHAAASRSC